ncbi:MAG: hypothetical protein ACREPM_18055, partial [Gemmatimonadaceae bacterium]
HPGLAYVPIDLSPAQAAVNAQIQSFATQYKNFLGTDVITGNVTPAAGPGAQADFQSLLMGVGLDSLHSTDHTSIGDVSLGLSVQLLNTYGDTSAAAANTLKIRVAANGAYRFPTGQPGDRNRLFDVATGYGQSGIIGSVATDLQFRRRVSATATASYTAQIGSVAVDRVLGASNAIYPLLNAVPGTFTPGNVLQLSVIPRYRLGGYLAVTGQYSLVRTGADTYTAGALAPGAQGPTMPYGVSSWTAQQFGVGFTYSSIVRPARGPGAIPFETTFTHLETVSGNGGPVYKTFRDQIELRIYWKR